MFLGYKVKYVSNVTDIDDKIINKAAELKEDINKLTERNLKSHLQDYRAIGVEDPDIQPKATEHIPDMIDLIQRLEKKGYTYLIPEDGIYYDISKFKEYGKLSHQDMKKLIAGKRVKSKEGKRNDGDFVLWKFSKPDEPKYNSTWGYGRPGWHIECSAMSASLLGLPLDIHGGGHDLIFPHHEDEIAQSEVAYGKKLANYWIHNRMVNVDKVKMSKSLGNFRTIKDLLKEYDGEIIRFFVISAHYRKPIDFSKKILDSTKNSYNRLKNLVLECKDDGQLNKSYLEEFEKAMNSDLNTPQAVAVIWKLLRDDSALGKYRTLVKMDGVFGLNLFKKEEIEIPKDIATLVEKREKARKSGDWNLADKLRDEILKKHWNIDDTPKGPRLKKISSK